MVKPFLETPKATGTSFLVFGLVPLLGRVKQPVGQVNPIENPTRRNGRKNARFDHFHGLAELRRSRVRDAWADLTYIDMNWDFLDR